MLPFIKPLGPVLLFLQGNPRGVSFLAQDEWGAMLGCQASWSDPVHRPLPTPTLPFIYSEGVMLPKWLPHHLCCTLSSISLSMVIHFPVNNATYFVKRLSSGPFPAGVSAGDVILNIISPAVGIGMSRGLLWDGSPHGLLSYSTILFQTPPLIF